jgi:hypothetical protein
MLEVKFMKLKLLTILLFSLGLFMTLVGCQAERPSEKTTTAPIPRSEEVSESGGTKKTSIDSEKKAQKISLNEPEQTQSAQTVERKIIRNANLTLEANDPEETSNKISSLVAQKNGFVINSDTQQRTNPGGSTSIIVNLTLRVPATQFDATLSEIRALVPKVVQEKVTGQDVTEEFIDVEARLRTQKALEAQFLEILKQAKSVNETLEVQKQIAEVRGEIEKVEGRLRYLQNQTSLSTITITLRPPEAFAAGSTGFFSELGRAISDGINAALTVILFLIRAILALLPIIILLGVPIWLLVRYLKRKYRRSKLAQTIAQEEIKNEPAD